MNANRSRPRFSLFDELDRGLNHLVNEVLQQDQNSSRPPALSVYEFEDRYLVECDLPGVSLEDIELSFDDGLLQITGERKQTVAEDAKATADERHFGRFERKLKLGKDVNPEAVDAELGKGVLQITIPKSENVLPKQISIRKADETK